MPGSATILFRKLFEHVTIDDARLNEILSYPVDVDWVDACLQHHTCVLQGPGSFRFPRATQRPL